MATITPAASVGVLGSFATSPAASGVFIPSIWSGKLNAKFYATTVFGEIANTNYEGDIKNIGDKVVINNIPSISINNYTIGQTLNYQVPTPSKVELNITQAKYTIRQPEFYTGRQKAIALDRQVVEPGERVEILITDDTPPIREKAALKIDQDSKS
jgi:hypothetical protein